MHKVTNILDKGAINDIFRVTDYHLLIIYTEQVVTTLVVDKSDDVYIFTNTRETREEIPEGALTTSVRDMKLYDNDTLITSHNDHSIRTWNIDTGEWEF